MERGLTTGCRLPTLPAMRPLTFLALLAATFVGGMFLGKSSGLFPGEKSGPMVMPKLPLTESRSLHHRKPWTPFTGSGEEMLTRAEAASDHRSGLYFVCRAIEEADPAQLAQWAVELGGQQPSRDFQRAALAEVTRRWVTADVAAALDWAKSLEGEMRFSTLNLIISTLATKDIQRALGVAETLTPGWEHAQAICAIVDVQAQTDAKAAFALWQSVPEKFKNGFLNRLFEFWGQQDPASAYLALAHLPSKIMRDEARRSLFRAWGRRDPRGFLEAAAKFPSQEAGEAMGAAFRAWQVQDLDGALAWFESLPPEQRRKVSVSPLLENLAATDVNRAGELAATLTGQARLAAFSQIADGLAEADFEAAVKWIYGLPSLRDRKSALYGLLENVENAGPAATLAAAQQVPDGPARLDFLTKALCAVGGHRSPFKATVLNGLPLEEATRILCQSDELLRSFCDADARAASTWVARLPPARINKFLNELGSVYADQDPQAAYVWASELPVAQQALAMGGVLRIMAYDDGPGAYAKALQIADEQGRQDLLKTVLSSWMFKDPTAAEQAVQQTTGDVRSSLQDKLAEKKITDNPADGAAFLLSLLHSGNGEDAKAAEWQSGSLGRRWATTDPTAGVAWLGKLPEGKLREQFVQEFAANWTRQDPIAASAWIDTLPAGNTKDTAATKLVGSIHESDPERAAVWAGKIADQAMRESACRDVFPDWLKTNFAQAQQALQAADLPDSLKADWLKRAQPKQP